MCKSVDPISTPPVPDMQTFDSTEAFLRAIEPGMDLCTSDFTGWADVESVEGPAGGEAGIIVGRVRESGVRVRVPASVLLDIRGGHCVRIDRVRTTVDSQGWEVR